MPGGPAPADRPARSAHRSDLYRQCRRGPSPGRRPARARFSHRGPDLLRHPGRDDPALEDDRPFSQGSRPGSGQTLGLASRWRSPPPACWKLAYVLSRRRQEPPMTRFLARQLSTTHWFNIDAARRDLGYHPRVSIAEGLSGSNSGSIAIRSSDGKREHAMVRELYAKSAGRGTGWLSSLVLCVFLLGVYLTNGRDLGCDDTFSAGLIPSRHPARPWHLFRGNARGRGPDKPIPYFWTRSHGHIITHYPIAPALVPSAAGRIPARRLGFSASGLGRPACSCIGECGFMAKRAMAVIVGSPASCFTACCPEWAVDGRLPAVLAACLGSDLWTVGSQSGLATRAGGSVPGRDDGSLQPHRRSRAGWPSRPRHSRAFLVPPDGYSVRRRHHRLAHMDRSRVPFFGSCRRSGWIGLARLPFLVFWRRSSGGKPP